MSQTESPRGAQGSKLSLSFLCPLGSVWVGPLVAHMVPSLIASSLQATTLLSQLRDHLYSSMPTLGTDSFRGNAFICLYVSIGELFLHPPIKYQFMCSNMGKF